jgi:hypothetical protein
MERKTINNKLTAKPMQTNLTVIPTDQLKQMITDVVNVALRNAREEAPETVKPANVLPELMTKKETAETLRVSIGTVDNYTRDGLLTKKRVGLRAVRFDRGEVQRLARTI